MCLGNQIYISVFTSKDMHVDMSNCTCMASSDCRFSGNFFDLNFISIMIKRKSLVFRDCCWLYKCEMICHNSSTILPVLSSFPDLNIVNPSCAPLLGSPLGNATALHLCLDSKAHQLKFIRYCLCHLESHDVLIWLRHALDIPKYNHYSRVGTFGGMTIPEGPC